MSFHFMQTCYNSLYQCWYIKKNILVYNVCKSLYNLVLFIFMLFLGSRLHIVFERQLLLFLGIILFTSIEKRNMSKTFYSCKKTKFFLVWLPYGQVLNCSGQHIFTKMLSHTVIYVKMQRSGEQFENI